MEYKLLKQYNTVDEAISDIQLQNDRDIKCIISKISTMIFTQNGNIMQNNLDLDQDTKKNIILFNGPDNNSKLILSPKNINDMNELFINIWNWKVYYVLLVEDYFVVDIENEHYEKDIYTSIINDYNSFQWFNHILYNNLDWGSLKEKTVSKNNIYIQDTAIKTALRLILIGNDIEFPNHIYTDIQGKDIYAYELEDLSLKIFYKMDCNAQMGINKCLLFQYNDVRKNKYKKDMDNILTIDKIPISYLLANGLKDKLNSFFDVENSKLKITYEKFNTLSKIWIEW